MQELVVTSKTPVTLLEAFGQFLRVDVANGDASLDTLRCYRSEVAAWVRWCQEQKINPAEATTADVKTYRQDLVNRGYKPATIAHRLAVLGRFYAAAQAAGLREDNPAAGVRAPRDRRSDDDFCFLSAVDLALLLRALPRGTNEKDQRDRCLVAMLALQGLRTVELVRANVEDLERRGETWVLRVRGKNHNRMVYLRSDVAEALTTYLAVRRVPVLDELGTPLFTAVGNRAGGQRISRRGIRQVVDFYLLKADLKRPGVSNHALRHSFATAAYAATYDLRAVQDALGHTDPRTTSRYAHVVDRARANVAAAVPVTL